MENEDEKARPRAALPGILILLALLGIYHLDGGFLHCVDSMASHHLPISIVREGNLSFRPVEAPALFRWNLPGRRNPSGDAFQSWNDVHAGKPMSHWRDTGQLSLNSMQFCVVRSVRPGLFVNTFGIGPGLVALPIFAVLMAASDDLASDAAAQWYGGKFVGALTVSVSAIFVFLAAALFLRRRSAALLALAYALGTCVWSTSSQALLQHGPNAMFLAMGAYFLCRIGRPGRSAVWCGLALGAAFVCRPTSLLVLAAVGVWLLFAHRKALLPYALGALPLLIAVAVYNDWYLGAPWRFGQSVIAPFIAEPKTGSPQMWQTPMLTGLAGLLASPSRGLFVYSPFLLFALWGAVAVWRDRRFQAFRPLTIALPAIVCLEAKHFDWWSGWSFGYRHLVDLAPLLVVLLVPIAAVIFRRRALLALFAVLLAWSVGVQVLGAFAYNLSGWNARVVAGQEAPQDIDRPEHRHRLWSITDSQIPYYLRHFREARDLRQAKIRAVLKK